MVPSARAWMTILKDMAVVGMVVLQVFGDVMKEVENVS
jgi:hypothetical protein